jgi:hypothetical protein
LSVSAIAEYLCARLQLSEGRHELLVRFREGRYDRGRVDGRPINAAGAPHLPQQDRPVGP